MSQSESGNNDLNFDRAIPIEGAPAGGAAAVRCANCQREIADNYYTANGAPICARCRADLERLTGSAIEPATMVKALFFGLIAALAGGLIYWAVMRFLRLEIGLVAILNGWMIGKAIRLGTDDRGGRLLQVVAVLLVYLSVSLAYLPFAVEGARGDMDIVQLIVLLVTLPASAILGSMPSGLISALIIGFGMMQAWQLTAGAQVAFEGPFRVGGSPRT